MTTTPDVEKAAKKKARAIVYRLFKFRPRSEQEVMDKLKQKGYSASIIADTIIYFKNFELINDTVFAKAWIQSRLNKPFGLRRIKLELREKGIANSIIDEEIAKTQNTNNESDAIDHIIKKRCLIYEGLELTKAKRRLEGYLLRRGFEPSIIYKALRNKFKDYVDR